MILFHTSLFLFHVQEKYQTAFSFSLLFGSSVKIRMQYKITMKYKDAHTKAKVFTDQEKSKKPPSCQVRYLLRISYISRHMQFSDAIKKFWILMLCFQMQQL